MIRRNFLKFCLGGLLSLTPLLAFSKDFTNNIILSFDDVPFNLERMQILCSLLKKYGFLNSHFYITGAGLKKHPDSVKYLISQGFVVGWHSMNHELMRDKNDSDFSNDVIEWKNLLEKIVPYYKPKYARFPFGAGLDKQLQLLKNQGLEIFPCATRGAHFTNWDIDTMDWNSKKCYTKDKILEKIRKFKINDTIVILFHLELSKSYKSVNESLITSDLNKFEAIISSIVFSQK